MGFVLGLGHWSHVAAAPPEHQAFRAGAFDVQFAFADFDGDRQPDLAVLQVEQSGSLKMHYSITFALSGGSRQFLGLVAPTGGLELLSRDVNGDNTLDLVVTATWMHRTVAIFLNDGFGTFTSADPSRYLVDVQQSGSELLPEAPARDHHAALLQKQPRSGESDENGLCSPKYLLEPHFNKAVRLSAYEPQSAFSGRAPPNFSQAS
jgi:hypothetical protein